MTSFLTASTIVQSSPSLEGLGLNNIVFELTNCAATHILKKSALSGTSTRIQEWLAHIATLEHCKGDVLFVIIVRPSGSDQMLKA